MEKKILFLDLDGTLLNDAKEITDGNRNALEKAISQGHRVVITTGRPLASGILQAQRLGLDGKGCYLIAFNGAVVYDFSQNREIYRCALDYDTVNRVFREVNRRGIHIQTYDSRNVLVENRCDNENVRRYCGLILMEHRVIDSVERDLTEPPVKALAIDYHDKSKLLELEQWINTHLTGKADCFFSCEQYLEIVPVGMNKGVAVQMMCRTLGIPIEDSIAVGDAANDLDMIRAAGVGVAMCNGIPEAKAAADYITQRDNNHDGIAEVVEKFMGE